MDAAEKKIYNARYRRENRDQIRIQSRMWKECVRQKALVIMGGKCVVCAESAPGVLEFDHVLGGGREHREELGGGSHGLFKWINENAEEAHARLQVLCANCHKLKHRMLPNKWMV